MLLLACLLVQGTAVQTHLHFVQQTQRVAAATGDGVVKAGKEQYTADCPLCQEAAMAGAYVLPSATALPLPPPAPLWVAVATILAFDLLVPAHGWLSRAPPR